MNSQIISLIDEYQKNVLAVIKLMRRSGISMPLSSLEWIESGIPEYGKLEGDNCYFKHGLGCTVIHSAREVDFVFGEWGEIGGIDVWQLIRFAGSKLDDYGFKNKEALIECFQKAVTDEKIIYSGRGLYYLANDVQHLLAINVDYRQPEDILPLRNLDSILILYTNYFLAADLMLRNYENSGSENYKTVSRSGSHNIDKSAYLSSWLGFLMVTCEGFNKLNIYLLLRNKRPKDFKELIENNVCSIGNMMKVHSDSLRKLRNDIFHLRDSSENIYNFFSNDADRISWAYELHTALASFFSEYHILCEMHYIKHERKSESVF